MLLKISVKAFIALQHCNRLKLKVKLEMAENEKKKEKNNLFNLKLLIKRKRNGFLLKATKIKESFLITKRQQIIQYYNYLKTETQLAREFIKTVCETFLKLARRKRFKLATLYGKITKRKRKKRNSIINYVWVTNFNSNKPKIGNGKTLN
ncbi:hypothetical protein GGTG_11550 [Gaeumannomyces tritici R3-111a-1]|uniref:Uncharacterized protein n=1 Tax=Gaeumannomyces tritici (strain R3-111a-1) TaxID=644352 RepID=J3PDH7_GAET3|nr:hypothetical protein GGTG_11550 [Gaeumannomyces tritici R3-111a-1]EJT70527.1 hypothetical protein GGTG_11550 [Gaeumannomyces tritici R3-111a-1]